MDHADRKVGFLNKNCHTNVMTYDCRYARGFDTKKQALLFASMMKIEYYRRPMNRSFQGKPAFVRVLSSPRTDGKAGWDYVGDKQYGWIEE